MKKSFVSRNMWILLYIVIITEIVKYIGAVSPLIIEVLKNHYWYDLVILVVSLSISFIIGSFVLEDLFNEIKNKIN